MVQLIGTRHRIDLGGPVHIGSCLYSPLPSLLSCFPLPFCSLLQLDTVTRLNFSFRSKVHQNSSNMISTPKHAHFTQSKKEESDRKRVLTMKYGKQQIELIRKRLRVEAWLVEALETLCARVDNADGNLTTDIDIDEVLDIETEGERRKWLQDQLKECPASREDIQKFIGEMLERLKTL